MAKSTSATERIPAADGLPLGASLYVAAGAPAATVLIAPATGVARRLYDPFARHLTGAGFDVVTWDWRGTGDSKPPSLRGFQAIMSEWARLDFAGVLAWARQRAPAQPLVAVGHSFGGQSLGLVPGGETLAAAVTVAAQNGWWGHWPAPRRYLYALLWHALMPALTHALGYFPSSRLGLGEDLPRGVALEWARWCRSPRYLGDWTGHRAFTAPILALGFADDAYAPAAAVDALHREYSRAAVERRQVAPDDLGVPRIGHFGFFKPGLPLLWDDVAQWLQRAANARRTRREGAGAVAGEAEASEHP